MTNQAEEAESAETSEKHCMLSINKQKDTFLWDDGGEQNLT